MSIKDYRKGEFLVNDILPSREVHLLAGPSGVGKTAVALQVLDAVRRGLPVFGHPTRQVPCGYVAADRPLSSAMGTAARVGVLLNEIPAFSVVDKGTPCSLENTVTNLNLGSGFVVIDGTALFSPGGKLNDYRSVWEPLRDAARLCAAHDVTILGITHSSKLRTDARYENVRERILGSVGFAAFSSTVILVEPADPKHLRDRRRRPAILPRNAPPEELELVLDDQGAFPVTATGIEFLNLKLRELEPATVVRTAEILGWAQRVGLPERTAESWITSQLKTARALERVGRGLYRVKRRPISLAPRDFVGRGW